MKTIKNCLVTVFILISVLSCTSKTEIKVLYVGVLPDQRASELKKRYLPLLKYLAKKTGYNYVLKIPENYNDLLDGFNKKALDIAYFGGFTFVKANRSSGAMPLVIRDVDVKFVSYFIARKEHMGDTLENFKNMRIAFGSKLSTSGNMMPRFYLKKRNINPEDYFKEITYTGAHDKTVLAVRDGLADLGVVNSVIYEKMAGIAPNGLKIVWKTPPYADYIWAIQKSVDKKIKDKIIDAFMSLDWDNLEHREILQTMGAKHFLPGVMSDYHDLINIAEELGLLES